MGHSGRFVSAMEQVAPDFPKTQFIAVSGNEGKPPNVMSIDWNNAQFGCQLGHLAARMSKTGKVGGVYGLQGVPNITAQAGGFRICAEKAGAKVTILYIKDMEDAAEAKEAALSLIAGGADVITGKLNAAEAGLVQAAKEKNVYATGRGPDQTKIAPALVLTNIVEDWPAMFGSTADQVKSRQALRNLRAIWLRHGARHWRLAAIRAREAVQSDRARSGRQGARRHGG